MSQHDMIIANDTFANVRADFNLALAALVSSNSGVSEPTTTYAYMWWYDLTNHILKMRNAANTGWIDVFVVDSVNDLAYAVEAPWEDFETVYDASVDGSVASVETSGLVDGYEYRWVCQRVGSNAASGDLQVALADWTGFTFGGWVSVSFDVNGSGGEGFYGIVSMTETRELNRVFAFQGYGWVSSSAMNTNHASGASGSYTTGPVNGGWIHYPSNEKIVQAKFRNAGGNLANNGKIIGQRRRIS